MPTLLVIEIIVAFILFIFTIISVIDSVRSKKDPLMKRKISVQCPCCKSKNIRFQSIQVNRGKPFSVFSMLNFISSYFFAIINFFYILSEEEEMKNAFFQAISGTQLIETTVKSATDIYILGCMTKIFLIAGTVFLVICMLMPNEIENQLAKICMDCGSVSDADSEPEPKKKEPIWAVIPPKND